MEGQLSAVCCANAMTYAANLKVRMKEMEYFEEEKDEKKKKKKRRGRTKSAKEVGKGEGNFYMVMRLKRNHAQVSYTPKCK
jgi:hypothetical protein